MLTPHTVQQVLQVFRLFRINHSAGMPVNHSYHEAVRKVAETYSVAYQTIGDGCRRRLELTNINQLYEMLSAWMRGEPRELLRQLKEHADPAAHSEIDRLFSTTEPVSSPKPRPSVIPTSIDESETVSFRLKARDARMLRALAELEGISVGEITGRIVAAAVHDRMKVVARGFIEERPVHA